MTTIHILNPLSTLGFIDYATAPSSSGRTSGPLAVGRSLVECRSRYGSRRISSISTPEAFRNHHSDRRYSKVHRGLHHTRHVSLTIRLRPSFSPWL